MCVINYQSFTLPEIANIFLKFTSSVKLHILSHQYDRDKYYLKWCRQSHKRLLFFFLKNISLNNKKITVRFREVKKKFLTFFHAQFLLKNNPTHIFSEWIHLLTERNQVAQVDTERVWT